MDPDTIKLRALDLLIQSMDDLAATAKLQLGLSTGAVVLFVHLIAEGHEGRLQVGILTLASLFFGISAVRCVQGLVYWSVLKTRIATSWVATLSGGEHESERPGDLFLRLGNEELEASKKKFGHMERLFNAGVACSVLFLLAEFVLLFRR